MTPETTMVLGTEAVLQSMGDLGRYQAFQMVLQMMNSVVNAFPTLVVVFIGYEPDHLCKTANNTVDIRPRLEDSAQGDIASLDYGTCSIDVTINDDVTNTNTSYSLPCVAGHNFSMPSHTSFTTEWSLVCEKSGLTELSQTLIMVGMMLGALVFSSLSDRFGRKTVYVFSALGLLLTTSLTSFVPNYPLFLTLRVITGALQQGIGLAAYTMFMELLPRRWKSICSVVDGILWSLGGCVLVGVAYLMEGVSWRYINLALSACFLYSLLLPCLLDESIRWLMASGQTERVKAILKKACRMNGTDFEEACKILTKLSPQQDSRSGKHNWCEGGREEGGQHDGDSVTRATVATSNAVKEDRAVLVKNREVAACNHGKGSVSIDEGKPTLIRYNKDITKAGTGNEPMTVTKNGEGGTKDVPLITFPSCEENVRSAMDQGETIESQQREETESNVDIAQSNFHQEDEAISAACPFIAPAPVSTSITTCQNEAVTTVTDPESNVSQIQHSCIPNPNMEQGYSAPVLEQKESGDDSLPDAHKTKTRSVSTPVGSVKTAASTSSVNEAFSRKGTSVDKDGTGDGHEEGVGKVDYKYQLEEIVTAKYTVLDLFRHREVLVPLFVCTLVWASNSLYYYGVMLGSSTLSGNRFLNFAILNLLDIPAIVVAFFLLPRINRKPLSMTFGAVAALSLLLSTGLIQQGDEGALTAARVAGFVGKFCLSGSYSVLFLFSLEVFPTCMRTAGIGCASAMSRLAAMTAPFVLLLGKRIPWAPGVMMGCLCLLATLSITLLPETRRRQLPDTIEKIRSWKTSSESKKSCVKTRLTQ